MALGVSQSIHASVIGAFENGNIRGFLNNDGVGISDFHEFDAIVSDETKAEVEQIRQDIIDGTITLG
jgi:basic membrane protein A